MPFDAKHSGSTPPLEARDPTALVGLEIGDFEIVREIGRGGMGTVFQARQKSLNRIVALKVLSSGLGLTQSAVLRFQREAQAAAKLHHDNIVPIHAQGESNGVYYYAMELIRGENLNDVISRARGEVIESSTSHPAQSGKLPTTPAQFEKIARLIAAVADAIDYAHRQGIIHRDVKPHNLILSDDERIYVSDFGLARVLEQPGVTTTGEFVGSPLYMSPEQIVGGRRKVDKRTDIYSLGATLYEWLTLSPPYPGETREQVISKVITSEAAAACSLNPHIPVNLETICLKALEKEPSRRYQSAAAFRDDLHRFMVHEAIRAKRAGVVSRAGKFVLRNKVSSVAAAALVVAATLTFALVRQTRRSRDREEKIAAITETTEVLEQETAELHEAVKAKEAEVAITRAKNEMIRSMLEGQSFAQQIKKMPGATELLEVLASGPEPDRLARRTADMFLDRQRMREAQRLEARLGPGEGAAHDLYLQALASDDLAQAAVLTRECLRLDQGHINAELLAAALALANHDYARTKALAATVIRQRPNEPEGYLLHGVAELFAGDLAESIADFDTALELGAEISWALSLRGMAHRRAEDLAPALRDFNDALVIAPDNVLALLERGWTNADLKNYEAAVADAGRVIELEPDNAEGHVLRGDCYDALGRYRESSEDYTRAITLGPASARIGTKLWQAIYKRETHGSNDADTPKANAPDTKASKTKNPNMPTKPRKTPPAPRIAPGAGAGQNALDWLNQLLERKHRHQLYHGDAHWRFRSLFAGQR